MCSGGAGRRRQQRKVPAGIIPVPTLPLPPRIASHAEPADRLPSHSHLPLQEFKTQWPFNPDSYLGYRGPDELETVTGESRT